MHFFIQHRFSTLRWIVVSFGKVLRCYYTQLYIVPKCCSTKVLGVIYVLFTQVLSLRENLNLHTTRLRKIS